MNVIENLHWITLFLKVKQYIDFWGTMDVYLHSESAVGGAIIYYHCPL